MTDCSHLEYADIYKYSWSRTHAYRHYFTPFFQVTWLKGLDIYIPPLSHLQRNPEQQWFTIRSGVLTGNDTRLAQCK